MSTFVVKRVAGMASVFLNTATVFATGVDADADGCRGKYDFTPPTRHFSSSNTASKGSFFSHLTNTARSVAFLISAPHSWSVESTLASPTIQQERRARVNATLTRRASFKNPTPLDESESLSRARAVVTSSLVASRYPSLPPVERARTK